jgi:hypothetical protein
VKAQGLKLANEWVKDCVKECGDTIEQKQQSSRKKLPCHKLSVAHIEACETASLAKKKKWKH